MTFLLFLASVAVLEYLVRDIRPASSGNPSPFDTQVQTPVALPVSMPMTMNDLAYEAGASPETATADLLSLGKALGGQKTPVSEEIPTKV